MTYFDKIGIQIVPGMIIKNDNGTTEFVLEISDQFDPKDLAIQDRVRKTAGNVYTYTPLRELNLLEWKIIA